MLSVNEIFGPTIQGEGKSLGKKVIFIRLATCNLTCVWCDTPYTWNWKKHDRMKEVHLMTTVQIIDQVRNLGDVKSVVISGGEPLIQQPNLKELVVGLKSLGYWVEIETNGTQVPSDEISKLVDQFNCSPKLSNSEVRFELRIRKEALEKLASLDKTTFKFVIGNPQDIEEIQELVNLFQMKQVYLMPLGKTIAELNERKEMVRRLCKERGFNFTPRLHIEIYGAKRAV